MPPADDPEHGHSPASPAESALTDAPDFDDIWKEALQRWLPEFLILFRPDTHALIDWSSPPIFLHQELQRLHRIMKRGARHTDLLVELRLRAGGKLWLLLHLEVETCRVDLEFNRRMFEYRILLCGKYPERPILSCAIVLGRKDGPDTETYVHDDFGDSLTFTFPVINLASWQHRMAELEALALTNPFAVIVLAQLECSATQPDATRPASKLKLTRALEKGNHGFAVRGAVFRIIDSLLTLPEALDQRFMEVLEQSEEPAILQQLSSIDRYLLRKEREAGEEAGIRKGEIKGATKGAAHILSILTAQKFGALPDWAVVHLAQATESDLECWTLRVLDARRIEDIFG